MLTFKQYLTEQDFQPDLDQKIFDGTNLRNGIRNRLLLVAQDIESGLYSDIPYSIIGLTFTGSMCGYSWRPDSDIDLHFIVDFTRTPPIETPLLKKYLSFVAKEFSSKKYLIHGHPIEVYFQDKIEPFEAPGIYDLINNHWIKTPTRLEGVSEKDINASYSVYSKRIQDMLAIEYHETPEGILALAMSLLKEIVDMRKQALKLQGLDSLGNWVFKKLRYSGDIALLVNRIRDIQNQIYGME